MTKSYEYFSKLKSFEHQNRTSGFIINWKNKTSFLNVTVLLAIYIWGHMSLRFWCWTFDSFAQPVPSFEHVSISEVIITNAVKYDQHPELLKQLDLEFVPAILPQALVTYTNASTIESGRSYIRIFLCEIKCGIRKSDHYSLFKSEIIVINKALNYAHQTKKLMFRFLQVVEVYPIS